MTLPGDRKAAIVTSTHKITRGWFRHCDYHSEAEEHKDCREEELHVARFDDDDLDIIESRVLKLYGREKRSFNGSNFAVVLKYGVVKPASYIFR